MRANFKFRLDVALAAALHVVAAKAARLQPKTTLDATFSNAKICIALAFAIFRSAKAAEASRLFDITVADFCLPIYVSFDLLGRILGRLKRVFATQSCNQTFFLLLQPSSW